jgi:hypothetical protein
MNLTLRFPSANPSRRTRARNSSRRRGRAPGATALAGVGFKWEDRIAIAATALGESCKIRLRE